MKQSVLEHVVLRRGPIAIRPARISDEPLMRSWLSDPRIFAWWGGAPACDEYVREHCVPTEDTEGICWPFIIMFEEEPAGFIQAWRSETSAGLDLFIAPGYRRRRVGSRAAVMLASHLRSVLGWTRITADPDPSNGIAIGMWRKAGFEPDASGLLYIFKE